MRNFSKISDCIIYFIQSTFIYTIAMIVFNYGDFIVKSIEEPMLFIKSNIWVFSLIVLHAISIVIALIMHNKIITTKREYIQSFKIDKIVSTRRSWVPDIMLIILISSKTNIILYTIILILLFYRLRQHNYIPFNWLLSCKGYIHYNVDISSYGNKEHALLLSKKNLYRYTHEYIPDKDKYEFEAKTVIAGNSLMIMNDEVL